MKQLSLIVHANIQQDLADQLRSLAQVSGFTFCRVEGHSAQADSDPLLSARDKVVGYIPRVRVEILLEDENVKPVLEALRNATYGLQGQGVYWVTPVEENGYL